MEYKIVENSIIARVARIYMRSKALAITFGNYVHISGVKKEEFLKNRLWVEHEMEHVRQYQKYGFGRFILLYLWESIRKGYYHNKFEVEARAVAEEAVRKQSMAGHWN